MGGEAKERRKIVQTLLEKMKKTEDCWVPTRAASSSKKRDRVRTKRVDVSEKFGALKSRAKTEETQGKK